MKRSFSFYKTICMAVDFYKYQGAGNDFIIIDNRKGIFGNKEASKIALLCNRRFGIGADGLMLLENQPGFDFRMLYYNADGNEGSMCGNGGRCIADFASKLGIVSGNCKFIAVDGEHEATMPSSQYVELKMGQLSDLLIDDTHCFLNTGSPHDIRFVDNADEINVYALGKSIRNNDKYIKNGVNVNFVEVCSNKVLKVYTYERGVEDETLACGTGVTAAALAYFLKKTDRTEGEHLIITKTKGGELSIRFNYQNEDFSNIWLCGPAVAVFKGEIEI
jgi:diaminopimelate epimerase